LQALFPAFTHAISCNAHGRYIAIGHDVDGDGVFREKRLPNCYLHLAWARRSYLDKRSPVSVRSVPTNHTLSYQIAAS
jgi:hypothetical protein